ncbi:uncharacterized protein LOC130767152 [Actinidia eriantha]|uniref:uncharacterized protein LOC130766865 n=1 Tax=Actinidia eriantha TaxID=165200 RepID=UPI002585AF21|nr:uncharacterized protein LOC130766865 [Actinidia eriantha]XP_057479910.1 uncharacterized protein LOC130767152 [Actinidia eriantha]
MMSLFRAHSKVCAQLGCFLLHWEERLTLKETQLKKSIVDLNICRTELKAAQTELKNTKGGVPKIQDELKAAPVVVDERDKALWIEKKSIEDMKKALTMSVKTD